MDEHHWLRLVELFEYKVADLAGGREPRGGGRALRELRTDLIAAPLVGGTLRRFRNADRGYRAGEPAHPPEPPAPPPDWPDLELPPEPEPPQGEEGRALRELAAAAWRTGFEAELRAEAARLRAEPGRPTLRLVYAALHNLDQHAETPGFAQNASLSRFAASFKVPAADDPLASLASPGVAEEVLADLGRRCLLPGGPHPALRLPPGGALPYLRRFVLAVADDPVAGAPATGGLSSREIGVAVEEARRERLPLETRRALLERLNAQLEAAKARERAAGLARDEERRVLKAAAEALLAWLAERLPESVGGQGREPPPPPLLEPGCETPPQGATEVAVRLARPGGVRLGGLAVGWHPSPEGWALEIGGAQYPLGSELQVPCGAHELHAHRRGDLALLAVRKREGSSLLERLALARCAAALLQPELGHENLRLARAALGWLRDRRVEPPASATDTSERLAAVSEDALLALARAGAERLLERLGRDHDAGLLERAFGAAAEALDEPGGEARAIRLARVFAAPPSAGAPGEGREVRREGEVVVLAYRGEPVTVRVMGRPFTVRAGADGRVSVLAEGGARPLDDVLPLGLPGGFALFAREGLRVAVGFATLA